MSDPARAPTVGTALVPATLEPYRVMFPLGALFGALGALLWPLQTVGLLPYSGPLHAAWMIQGFETCFVLGFFLTALPGFTRGPRCRRGELLTAFAGLLAFGVFSLVGQLLWAGVAFALVVAVPLIAAETRLLRSRHEPPEEFVFVRLGLAVGLAGSVALAASAAGVWTEPVPRFAQRLLSLGMVLPIVLGFGGLLVPTFTGMRGPLAVPGFAKSPGRGPLSVLYGGLAFVLLAALAADATGRRVAGAWLRAGVAVALGLIAWKLFRLPGRRDLLSYALWSAGWLLVAGLVTAALAPLHAVAALHLTFIGGFGLLTFGIGTRVVVSHGGAPREAEGSLLTPWVVGTVALALGSRLAAEFLSGLSTSLLTLSGIFWIAAWMMWAGAAWPHFVRQRVPMVQLASPRATHAPAPREPKPDAHP